MSSQPAPEQAMLMSDERDQFQSRVEHLVEQVKRWVEPHEWVTKDYPKNMRDANGHSYPVSALFLQRGPTRLLLDPIAYDVPGAQGVVDLYLMPTYDDMASLYFEDGHWTIHYPFAADAMVSHSAIDTSVVPLGEETINQVLDLIAAHAEPSF